MGIPRHEPRRRRPPEASTAAGDADPLAAQRSMERGSGLALLALQLQPTRRRPSRWVESEGTAFLVAGTSGFSGAHRYPPRARSPRRQRSTAVDARRHPVHAAVSPFVAHEPRAPRVCARAGSAIRLGTCAVGAANTAKPRMAKGLANIGRQAERAIATREQALGDQSA